MEFKNQKFLKLCLGRTFTYEQFQCGSLFSSGIALFCVVFALQNFMFLGLVN